jgi:DNA-binding CsgD family transcriptional regulator
MSANEASELRLDYKDIAARKLIIVIEGLPVGDQEAATSGAGGTPSSAGSAYGRGASPSAPLTEDAETIGEAMGAAPALFIPLLLAAWRGKEALALELIAATLDEAAAEDGASAISLTEYARAVLYNGLGRYRESFAAAQRGCCNDVGAVVPWVQDELVEAAARSNAREVAREAVGLLDEQMSVDETDWGRGVRARSAALLSDGYQAEALYRRAIELLARSGIAVHLARAQLVYGEWLRRENRRLDARLELRAAYETFDHLDASGFAERAFRELRATGETARKRIDEARDTLTPQEAQIARLAGEGLSNPEIGARLYISPRTAQYHLRKVFRKLDITSRNQLCRIPPSRLDG